ncbi:MAG: hypothetical protein ACK2VD_23010 [Anaerolineae bacterium]|jgi:hypothetical protein
MDPNAFVYLEKMMYEERLREAEEARQALRVKRAKRLPPLLKMLWLLFF